VWNNFGNLNPDFKLELTMTEQKTGLPDWTSGDGQESWTDTAADGTVTGTGSPIYTPY
jgi:hypothetical protein